jgi:hypothetical protein
MGSGAADVDLELVETLSAATMDRVSATARRVPAAEGAGHRLQQGTLGKYFFIWFACLLCLCNDAWGS